MGSSGASAAAAAVAAQKLMGYMLPQRELVKLAAQGEAAVAGSAHADNVSASLFGGFILVGDGYDIVRMDTPEVGFVVVVPDVKYANKTKMARDLAVLEARGARPETVVFEGGHEWGEPFLRAAGGFLGRISGV